MGDSSKICGHITNFFYGSLETGVGTTSPLSPNYHSSVGMEIISFFKSKLIQFDAIIVV